MQRMKDKLIAGCTALLLSVQLGLSIPTAQAGEQQAPAEQGGRRSAVQRIANDGDLANKMKTTPKPLFLLLCQSEEECQGYEAMLENAGTDEFAFASASIQALAEFGGGWNWIDKEGCEKAKHTSCDKLPYPIVALLKGDINGTAVKADDISEELYRGPITDADQLQALIEQALAKVNENKRQAEKQDWISEKR